MALKDPIQTGSLVSLADFTLPSLLVPHLRGRETAGVIKELSQVLHREGCVPDASLFCTAALNREFLVNTAIECGLAFPHARLPGLRQPVFALGRSDPALAWGTRGTQPVQLVFLLAVPATDAAHYLHLISSLARLDREPSFLDRLRGTRDSSEMHDLLRQVRVQTSRPPGI